MTKDIQMPRQNIGLNHQTYFVADIAANHDGDLDRAKTLIQLAATAGANAAKFQNFTAKTIVSDVGFKSLGAKQSHQTNWGKDVYQVYDKASLPMDWTEELKAACDKYDVDYFTAPYDIQMIPMLSQYVCAWKIGSGDITWHSHIEAIARDGKPVFLATGASEMHEVESAVELILKHTDQLVLMQCNTNYTASLENFQYVSLNVLKLFAKRYPEINLGLSDHTPGHVTVLGAVALGARVIEKHFTDDTTRQGPDHVFSMDPQTWNAMVDATRYLEAALGVAEKKVMENEKETVALQRRSIRASQNIKSGERIDIKSIQHLRPCPKDGLPPYREDEIVGKRASRDIWKGDHICLKDVI